MAQSPHIQLLKTEPPTTVTRTPRTPMAVRARQTMAALEVLKARGILEFTAGDVAREIDQRLPSASVLGVLYELQRYKAVALTTPTQSRYRRWTVVDWSRLEAFRTALAEDETLVLGTSALTKAALPAPPTTVLGDLLQRFLAAWRRPRLIDPRVAELEAALQHQQVRLTTLEQTMHQLLVDLGERPADEEVPHA